MVFVNQIQVRLLYKYVCIYISDGAIYTVQTVGGIYLFMLSYLLLLQPSFGLSVPTHLTFDSPVLCFSLSRPLVILLSNPLLSRLILVPAYLSCALMSYY